MRFCKSCQQEKPLSEFILTARKVPHVKCNLCKSKYEKEYRDKNKMKCKLYRKKSANQRFDENMSYIAQYLKAHPCVDCGETNIVKLEFDHRYDKKYAIADMRNNYRLEVVKTEIDKCDVRCANCHRWKTAKERNYKILQYL